MFFAASSLNAQVASKDSLNLEIQNKIDKAFSSKSEAIDKQLAIIALNKNKQIEAIYREFSIISKKAVYSQMEIDSLKLVLKKSSVNIAVLVTKLQDIELLLDVKFTDITKNTNKLGEVTSTLSQGLTDTKKSVIEVTESSSKNSNSIDSVSQDLNQKQQYGLISLVLFLILVLTVYIILTRRQNQNTKKLAAKQKEIFEKQIQDSQQLADWLSNQSSENLEQKSGGKIDHSFAKRVADEIVRITTNLFRMDDTIKGYKQLAASVRKLEQSLNANHYELEDLLNKPYVNGMNLQVNFVVDDTLKEGESIITRVIKPQINYKGKLIQVAQVEVSQGE
tara:strand:+ start:1477 stop:2484 length:1008 start_codon:yes stop_codon:yes gene_type:complete